MVAFDAEVYLRRLGERLLDDPGQQQPGHWSALRGAAAALVGAGAISADRAWRVIDDYATATRIRSGKPGFIHFGPPLRRRTAGSLMPRQTRVIDQEIPVGQGQLLLRDLAITADGNAALPPASRRSGLRPCRKPVRSAGRFPVDGNAPRDH